MAKKRTRQPTDMTAAISDTAEHYAIAEILEGRRNENSQLEYLIKWKDRPESEQSWQSVDDLFAKKKSSPEVSRGIALWFRASFYYIYRFKRESECWCDNAQFFSRHGLRFC